jgi:phosphoribosylanthranilate isomerase
MSCVKIKICGITDAGDALACAEAGAEYVGFIFYAPSPRYISPAAAGRIVEALPAGVTPVGVFVNETPASITAAVAESRIRLVQMSGDESPMDCEHSPLPVIKVFRAGAASGRSPDPSAYSVFARMADGGAPGEYGGTGKEPDSAFVRSLSALGRLFLAGGLHERNVAARIAGVRPFAVDVSSGVEMRPGVKDHALVRSFCSIVKSFTF